MSSPVDTSVKHFYSAMAGAPVLNGVAGSLIALLDACLVTGWGLKAVDSATISAGVCRLNFASGKSAAEVDAVVLVAGASPAGLNGEQRVTAISSNWVEFKTALPDGTVTGSVSFKMAPAGWTKPFSGTNLAVYQSADAQSTKMFVRIDDTAADHVRLRGYETMSDVNTGAGLFPLDAQIAGGGYLNKAAGPGPAPVKWRLVADGRGMYLSVVGYSFYGPTVESGRTVFIGDFQAYRPGGDPYAFVIGSGPSSAYSDTAGVCDQGVEASHYAARAYHGIGGAVAHSSVAEVGSSATSGTQSSLGAFPSVIDGGLRLSRRFVAQGSTPRGVFPGLYTVPQSEVGLTIPPLYRQQGAGPTEGRVLLAIGCGASSQTFPSPSLGISFIDITGPWGR
ncbi:MAG: hypothetical protein RR701_07290 [Comamonas sp.]